MLWYGRIVDGVRKYECKTVNKSNIVIGITRSCSESIQIFIILAIEMLCLQRS